MFWADKVAQEIEKGREKDGSLIVRDEKTASGRVHIGSMRGVAIHGVITDVLKERGFDAEFKYEINDFDPMDGIPAELPAAEWEQYLGLPLNKVPSPDGKAKNFAEYYAEDFMGVIEYAGFKPSYYRNSEVYASGKMNEVIRMAIEHAADIRRIYKEVSGSQKNDDWLPISMLCEKCGKVGTTQGYAWDGDKISYRCLNGPGGAKGCEYEGAASPFDGAAKLPWKVEWPAKWKVVGVTIEGAGKDHSTKGGSRDVGEHISREVFGFEPPHNVPYEFFLDSDGKKMSSSKGRGASSREIAENFPKAIFRLALMGKDPNQQFIIDPMGETLALLYDWHDKIAEKFWSGADDDDARLFSLVYHSEPPAQMYMPRFSVVAYIAQMAHLDPAHEFAALKGSPLTEGEKRELEERIDYTKRWLASYAPEKYKFILQRDAVPAAAKELSEKQKAALKSVVTYVEAHDHLDGPAFHEHLHALKQEIGITPKELFTAIYLSFLGRDSGPQAGWFLATLDRTFLLQRLKEVV